ncbi:hypothetical protein FRX31_006437 [Thalictrum thalictroides]|uniref:Uncharacterized protein n=1 Tax=Thalictrum thalictroides TaxID=46969 RepID=A0A7J6X569_THATH|nr:hypothetical protein FRX31_006437 [Thalictrum thalictroides]
MYSTVKASNLDSELSKSTVKDNDHDTLWKELGPISQTNSKWKLEVMYGRDGTKDDNVITATRKIYWIVGSRIDLELSSYDSKVYAPLTSRTLNRGRFGGHFFTLVYS